MMREMIDAFDRVDADDDVRAVIVTGAGRGFCAGADLSAGGSTFDHGGSDVQTTAGVPRDGGGMVSLRIFECLKPVIAAINGPAVGVGITMTLPMDIRLASTLGEDRVRVRPARHRARGLLVVVPAARSSASARRWSGATAGGSSRADEALAGGLVRSVHEPDDLLPAARAIAAEIVDNTSPVSVALTRRMLWAMLTADHPMEAHRVDSRAISERGRSADAREGVESFLEKRPAVFTDKVSDGLPDVFPEPTDPKVLVKPTAVWCRCDMCNGTQPGIDPTRTGCARATQRQDGTNEHNNDASSEAGDVIELEIDGDIVSALVLLANSETVIFDLCDGDMPCVARQEDLANVRVFDGLAA